MTEPRTEAGRRLLIEMADDVPWFIAGRDAEVERIRTIEAEAVQTWLDDPATVRRFLVAYTVAVTSFEAIPTFDQIVAAILTALREGSPK